MRNVSVLVAKVVVMNPQQRTADRRRFFHGELDDDMGVIWLGRGRVGDRF